MKTHHFQISGMDCAACTLTLDATLEGEEGITRSETVYNKQRTTVSFDERKVSVKDIAKVITKAGYTVVSDTQE